MKAKKHLAAFYWVLSLMAMSAEPAEDVTLKCYAIYLVVVVLNFAIASIIASNLLKSNINEFTTNRNGVSQRTD